MLALRPAGFGHQVNPRALHDPPPVPGDAGMPVPACPQHPALSAVPHPGCAMEDPTGSGAEPWAEGLHNSNNNAAPGGWPVPLGGHPLAPFGGPGAEPSYLGRVVLEIVESERTYARDLRSIVEGYLGKIIDAEEPVLRPEQVSALFGNIEDIYELSSTLLQNLESCASDPVAVAICFVTRSQEFSIYTQYCNNYPSSVAALAECMRSKAQARFLRECQERLRHALPLGAYLLKPVQRILKYHLLLQEIAKHFEHKSGDDYEVVLEAIDTMTCVAWYINDMKRKHEHAIRQQEIQSLLLGWKGPDLTSYGELVLEGTFRVQRARHERAVFLFDKTLLITKRRGDHYVYKSHIPCSSLMLIESTRDSLCFSLAHYKHIKQQHSLQAKSVEEKRVWTHHIKRLILENHHAIIPQKAKEAILEMDLFYPPRLPRCSPERLKKSWSCQPLDEPMAEPCQGRRQSEPFQHRDHTEMSPERLHGHTGRRQSEPAKQILRHLGEQGLKHAGSDGALLAMGEPPQHPRAWAAAEGLVEEEEEQEEEEELGRDSQEELPGAEELLMEPQEEQAGGHPLMPEPPKRPSSWGPGSCEKAGSTGEHPEVPEAPTAPSSMGTPALPQRGAEDLQVLSSEEEEEDDDGASGSILPPSVLDQASVIAERFGGGGSLSRRSSLALEGPSARPGSHGGSALSLDGSGLPVETGEPGGSPGAVPSPEPFPGARRGSLLSNRDRLLLDKIKSYYGNAEHRDTGFSVCRRESLSFIPKGLVRSSVSRFNSLPWPPLSPEPPVHPAPVCPVVALDELCQENGIQSPKNGIQTPENRIQTPENRIQTPENRIQSPKNGIQTPENRIQTPENRVQSPKNEIQTPENRIQTPENGIQSPRNGIQTPENRIHTPEPLLILEDDDLGTGNEEPPVAPPPRLLLPPSHPGTKVYQLARQYSLRIKSRRAGTRRAPAQPDADASCAVPRPGALPVSPSLLGDSPLSPGTAEPFPWPDVRELRARFGAARPPPVTRSRSAPEGPGRGGRPAEKERGSGRSRSAEAGGGPSTPVPARHGSDGALWVAAEAPLGAGQRVLVLEKIPAPPEPHSYVQIRSPTTREKICLKAVVERCKAYQASEEYRRRCPEPPAASQPPGDPQPLHVPQPPRHGLVRDLRQKFQSLDAAS
ncbi:pleckstrin homology domain-containing family G member 3 isoform X2 [Strigops habroptila]|uniref:pleckstrin homology domain-containing family G member 3 isoform X2 n=1 Tax=Strigops habroptila TaxID=2489341 RepID=UPI0011CF6718|nr:pleckstrin homology domain-containing family G member 3 isoform X2 [Strigops habroptila]